MPKNTLEGWARVIEQMAERKVGTTMANDVVQNKRPLLPISGRFASAPVEDLGEGIKSALASLSIIGNVFSINKRKTYKDLPPEMQRRIEVVILRGAKTESKAYYDKPFGTEANPRPACWSSDSIKPDAAVENKQSPQCNGCPKDTWVTAPNGRRQKLCGNNKRVALVPAFDIPNEADGGAMIFRVPQGSLANLETYSDEMKKMGIPYYAYTTFIELVTVAQGATRVTKLTFDYGRPLTDEEADLVLEMRDSQRVMQMVSDQVVPMDGGEPESGNGAEPPQAAETVQREAPPAAKPVTQGVTSPAVARAVQAAQQATQQAAAASINTAISRPATPPESQRVVKTTPAAVAAEENDETGETNEVEEAGKIPDELDGMFGNLFPGSK